MILHWQIYYLNILPCICVMTEQKPCVFACYVVCHQIIMWLFSLSFMIFPECFVLRFFFVVNLNGGFVFAEVLWRAVWTSDNNAWNFRGKMILCRDWGDFLILRSDYNLFIEKWQYDILFRSFKSKMFRTV